MAEPTPKKNNQRTYIIPLRREFLKSPKVRRAKKSITAIQEFLKRHMKTENVWIGPHLNHEVWKDGIQCPPSRVKVDVLMDGDIAKAELSGFKIEMKEEKKKKESKKTEDKSTALKKLGDLVKDKETEKKPEEKKEEKQEESDKKDEKEELKESRGKKKGKSEQEKLITKKGQEQFY